MPSKKYQRVVDSDAASFRRAHGMSSDAGKAILIVTEGVVTEPVYFEGIRRRLACLTVELVTYGAGAGDPRVLAQKALDLQEERRQKARNHELSVRELGEFDELWIVFDTDVIEPNTLNNGLQFANSNNIKLARSTPSVEFWFLLHFSKTTKYFRNCSHVIADLEKAMNKDYSKSASEAKLLIPDLLPNTQTAISHAKWVRDYHLGAGTKVPANPSTDIDILIEAIQNAASPANRPFQF